MLKYVPFDEAGAVAAGAVCNDQSVPGYYIREGTFNQLHAWLFLIFCLAPFWSAANPSGLWFIHLEVRLFFFVLISVVLLCNIVVLCLRVDSCAMMRIRVLPAGAPLPCSCPQITSTRPLSFLMASLTTIPWSTRSSTTPLPYLQIYTSPSLSLILCIGLCALLLERLVVR